MNTRIIFRISDTDFSETTDYLWFTDYHDKMVNKSKFYRDAVIPKISAARNGETESFDKLMQYVSLMGIDKVLKAIENPSTSNAVTEEQMKSIISNVLQSVQSKGVNVSPDQQMEIIEEVSKPRDPTKDELNKLLKLGKNFYT